LHKIELKAYQASARGGEVTVRYQPGKVQIGGEIVICLKGHIFTDNSQLNETN
jgi:predicted PhzF superfamily epimerase YddE/YHI9